MAFGELDLVVLIIRNDGEFAAPHRPGDWQQMLLRQREDDRNRLQLRYHHKSRRIGRMHDVALVDEP
jgi:hypothetical protein